MTLFRNTNLFRPLRRESIQAPVLDVLPKACLLDNSQWCRPVLAVPLGISDLKAECAGQWRTKLDGRVDADGAHGQHNSVSRMDSN